MALYMVYNNKTVVWLHHSDFQESVYSVDLKSKYHVNKKYNFDLLTYIYLCNLWTINFRTIIVSLKLHFCVFKSEESKKVW